VLKAVAAFARKNEKITDNPNKMFTKHMIMMQCYTNANGIHKHIQIIVECHTIADIQYRYNIRMCNGKNIIKLSWTLSRSHTMN